MNAQIAYQFLEPSLSQLNELEKERLCRLILGRKEPKKRDKIITKTVIKKKLLGTHFKSCT